MAHVQQFTFYTPPPTLGKDEQNRFITEVRIEYTHALMLMDNTAKKTRQIDAALKEEVYLLETNDTLSAYKISNIQRQAYDSWQNQPGSYRAPGMACTAPEGTVRDVQLPVSHRSAFSET